MSFIYRHKIPVLLFVLGILMFSCTLDSELLFSWDDNRYLEDNTLVRQFQIGKIFTEAYWGSYIPVTLFTYALEYKMWGLHPNGYHVVNTVIHALNGVLVFFFLFFLTRRRAAAVIGAVLFIVHPVQVESVAWVAQRKNLLSMFFFLWAFISHIRSRQEDSKGWLYAAWLFYLLSVLSKPAVVGAPILFMAYDYFWARISLRKTILSAIVPAAIAVFGAVAIIVTSSEVGGIKELWGGSRWAAMQLTFLTTWENLMGLLDIFAHSPHYLYFEDVIQGNWRVWAGLMVILAFAGLSIYSLVRFVKDKTHKPMTFFLALWVGAFMLPVSNIIPINIQRSDRHIYFPSVLLFLMVGLLWSWLWQRYNEENKRHLLVGAMVALSIYFMAGTYRYAQVWTNSGTLWTYHLKNFPFDDIAVNNLGMYYYRTKQYPMAFQNYSKLVLMAPKSFRPYLFPGLIAFDEGRYDDAIHLILQSMPLADEQLRKSIFSKLMETYAKAAQEANQQGRFEAEAEYYHGVIELLPDNPTVFNDLGNAYRKAGKVDEAKAAYRQAMDLSPEYYAAAHAGIGHVLLDQGQVDDARVVFEESLKKVPNAVAASGLCKIFTSKGNSEKALGACYIAAAMTQDTEENSDLLAESLLSFFSPDQAYAHATRQLASYPDLMHLVAGKIYAKSQMHHKAMENFGKSLHVLSLLNLGQSALSAAEYALADNTFKQVLSQDNENLAAIGGRCLALAALQENKSALPFCESAAKRQPRNAEYQAACADLLMSEERFAEAVLYYEKALDMGAEDTKSKFAAALTHLGHTAVTNGWTSDAIGIYKKVVALQPMDKESYFYLGRLYFQQKRYVQAFNLFDRLITIDPHSVAAFVNKGIAAHALGDNQTAEAVFKQALSIDPESPQALQGYCSFLKETGGNLDPICSQVRQSQS